MTDKFDWDASPSIKSTPGIIKSSSSSQVDADASEPSSSHHTLSFAQLERQLGHLVPCVPTDLQEPRATRATSF